MAEQSQVTKNIGRAAFIVSPGQRLAHGKLAIADSGGCNAVDLSRYAHQLLFVWHICIIRSAGGHCMRQIHQTHVKVLSRSEV